MVLADFLMKCQLLRYQKRGCQLISMEKLVSLRFSPLTNVFFLVGKSPKLVRADNGSEEELRQRGMRSKALSEVGSLHFLPPRCHCCHFLPACLSSRFLFPPKQINISPHNGRSALQTPSSELRYPCDPGEGKVVSEPSRCQTRAPSIPTL